MEFKAYTTTITIVPKNEPLYHEGATTITIEDVGGGPFLFVSQEPGPDEKRNGIAIDDHVWPEIQHQIARMLFECRMIESATEGGQR